MKGGLCARARTSEKQSYLYRTTLIRHTRYLMFRRGFSAVEFSSTLVTAPVYSGRKLHRDRCECLSSESHMMCIRADNVAKTRFDSRE